MTRIEIINAAIVRVGASPLPSLDYNNAAAIVANTLYDSAYKTALASFPWRFALKEETLAQLSGGGTLSSAWSYAHRLPPDCIRPLGLTNYADFAIHGDELYTQFQDPTLIYIRDVTEEAWPTYFSSALEYQLAADFAIPLTENTSTAGYYQNLAQRQWAIARGLDSQTSPPASLSANIDVFLAQMPVSRP